MKKSIISKGFILLLLLSMLTTMVGCLPFIDIGGTGDVDSDDPNKDQEEDKKDPPVDEDAADYKHVVIIGVDGAGAFFKQANTPNIDFIFMDGAVTYEAITSTPSISAHSWAS